MAENGDFRVGMIGCGQVAVGRHLPALASLPGFRVVALADIDRARLDMTAREFGVRGRHDDHIELLSRDDVDAVCVAVPASAHASIAAATLKAGKHVLVEKPLALTLDEADALIEQADGGAEPRSCAGVAFNLRSHRLVEQARRILGSGALGRLDAVRSVFTTGWDPQQQPLWRRRRGTGGGVLLELAVHHFDLWRYLLDQEVVDVVANSVSSDRVDDVTAMVHARMDGGAVASAWFSQASRDCNELGFFGDVGRMRLSLYRSDGLDISAIDDVPSRLRKVLRALRCFVIAVPNYAGAARWGGVFPESFRRQWIRFARSAREGGVPPCSLADGRQALAVALAAQEAAESGERVQVAMPRQATDVAPRETRQ